MGATATQRVALLSIHPKYADAILDGTKTVEFRRARIASDIDLVVVYATRPVGQVVGWFRIEDVVEDTPQGLWRRFHDCAGIDRDSYLSYFDSAKRAFGIRVRHAVRLAEPAPLGAIDQSLIAPQSFRYLPAESVASLLAA
jgi:predicted transcriptional regulator